MQFKGYLFYSFFFFFPSFFPAHLLLLSVSLPFTSHFPAPSPGSPLLTHFSACFSLEIGVPQLTILSCFCSQLDVAGSGSSTSFPSAHPGSISHIPDPSSTSYCCFLAGRASSLQPRPRGLAGSSSLRRHGCSKRHCLPLTSPTYKSLWLLENGLETASSHLLARNLELLASGDRRRRNLCVYTLNYILNILKWHPCGL